MNPSFKTCIYCHFCSVLLLLSLQCSISKFHADFKFLSLHYHHKSIWNSNLYFVNRICQFKIRRAGSLGMLDLMGLIYNHQYINTKLLLSKWTNSTRLNHEQTALSISNASVTFAVCLLFFRLINSIFPLMNFMLWKFSLNRHSLIACFSNLAYIGHCSLTFRYEPEYE